MFSPSQATHNYSIKLKIKPNKELSDHIKKVIEDLPLTKDAKFTEEHIHPEIEKGPVFTLLSFNSLKIENFAGIENGKIINEDKYNKFMEELNLAVKDCALPMQLRIKEAVRFGSANESLGLVFDNSELTPFMDRVKKIFNSKELEYKEMQLRVSLACTGFQSGIEMSLDNVRIFNEKLKNLEEKSQNMTLYSEKEIAAEAKGSNKGLRLVHSDSPAWNSKKIYFAPIPSIKTKQHELLTTLGQFNHKDNAQVSTISNEAKPALLQLQ